MHSAERTTCIHSWLCSFSHSLRHVARLYRSKVRPSFKLAKEFSDQVPIKKLKDAFNQLRQEKRRTFSLTRSRSDTHLHLRGAWFNPLMSDTRMEQLEGWVPRSLEALRNRCREGGRWESVSHWFTPCGGLEVPHERALINPLLSFCFMSHQSCQPRRKLLLTSVQISGWFLLFSFFDCLSLLINRWRE